MTARWIFETCPWGPFWSALLAGYCVVGANGKIYLTDAGASYLEEAA